MKRRNFALGLGAVAIEPLLFDEGTAHATPVSEVTPRRVGGIRIVDTSIAKAATELARTTSPPYLYNHAARTYLFGALIGRAARLQVDEELLYLASILHDLGLTEQFMGTRPFEIEGANAAEKFLSQQGLPVAKSAVVWDGIAMHPLAISQYKRPEIALVAVGAAADVVGTGLEAVSAVDHDAVLQAFPRLGFKSKFVATCADLIRRYPAGAGRTFMRDIGERKVPGFHTPNICDAIDQAPFGE
jgi:HD superfamily phosphodiesterase